MRISGREGRGGKATVASAPATAPFFAFVFTGREGRAAAAAMAAAPATAPLFAAI